MKRNDQNFDLLWDVTNLVGRFFSSALLGKRFRGGKELSAENRSFLTGLAWGGQIVGVGIAAKQSGQDEKIDESTLCLRFTVRRKVPDRRLTKEHRIPKRLRFEHLGRRILTDVVEHDSVAAMQAIGPGLPAAQNVGPTGTITAIVQANSPVGTVFALGCAHVLAPPGLNTPGQPVEAPPDNNPQSLGNVVGVLRQFTGFNSTGANFLDAALVELDPTRASQVTNRFPDGSTFGPIVTSGDQLQRQVRMFRGTTGNWTSGIIRQLNVTRLISYPGVGSFSFSGLVESRLFNAGGDSGSPVVIDIPENPVVSMHIGGDNRDIAWSVPMMNVLSHFSVKII
ncbi:hypothetical protein [Paludibaculum fermentans]|uniref:hypothetical protein n=1 Tax=Paludibaculum fermentans TaxID=1473598 RepID=UPI003EBB8AD9